jgi:hypothetical protein
LVGKGNLVLGQEQDSVLGGLFDASQAFSGKLAQVEIWDVELLETDIENLANCKIETVKESNRVVSWMSEKWEIHNVTIVETSLDNLCKPNPMMNQLVYLRLEKLLELTKMLIIISKYLLLCNVF